MIEYLLPVLLFIICLGLSAFFSSSEIALVSLTRAKVRTLLNDGKKGAKSLATLKETPNRFLISILVGNNIVNVAAASLATAVTISIFGDIGVGIATFVVVILLLIFGEIGPKMYASKHSEQLCPVICHSHPVPHPHPHPFDLGYREDNRKIRRTLFSRRTECH